MTVADDDDEEHRSRRQLQRANQRDVGERSARLARELMKLAEASLAKLDLDEDVRDAVDTARATRTDVARRRAERQLAGDLRRLDLEAVEKQLATFHETGAGNTRRFQDAEQWRARLIELGTAALAGFPGGGDDQLPELIEAAQRERATGKPRGAARALFRHIAERLKAAGA